MNGPFRKNGHRNGNRSSNEAHDMDACRAHRRHYALEMVAWYHPEYPAADSTHREYAMRKVAFRRHMAQCGELAETGTIRTKSIRSSQTHRCPRKYTRQKLIKLGFIVVILLPGLTPVLCKRLEGSRYRNAALGVWRELTKRLQTKEFCRLVIERPVVPVVMPECSAPEPYVALGSANGTGVPVENGKYRHRRSR